VKFELGAIGDDALGTEYTAQLGKRALYGTLH
jgi:hypothetical protein